MMWNGDFMVKIDQTLVIADAGPLIHLDELDVLDVLSDFDAVIVPNAVWLEVQHHRPQALTNNKIRLVRKPPTTVIDQVKAIATLYTLHHGEREALSECISNNIMFLITDDTAARLAAKNLNITAHGTIGLIIRAVRQNLKEPIEVIDLLNSIPEKTTLHIRPSLLSDIVSQIKKEYFGI